MLRDSTTRFVGPSVRWSVRPSVRPSVGRSVRLSVTLLFFGIVAYRDACARLMAIGLVSILAYSGMRKNNIRTKWLSRRNALYKKGMKGSDEYEERWQHRKKW